MLAPLAAVDPEPLSVTAVPTQYGPGETEMLAVGLGLTVMVAVYGSDTQLVVLSVTVRETL
jgi:hypothetical protein